MHRSLLLFLAVGCQAYEPLPLDPAAHEREWAGRGPLDERVRDYAGKLAALEPGRAPFDPADGLELHEAELVALVFHPRVRVARLEARVPELGAREAGRWDDPSLGIDVVRITESVPDPWVVATGLTFTIPLSGRPGAEKKKAEAEADVARRRALLAEWEVLGELRVAWARWFGARERIALLEAYLGVLDQTIGLARKQREANLIGTPELRIFEMEQATRTGRLATLRIEEERRRLAILALMGLAPGAEVELVPGLPLEVPPDGARSRLRERNLRLAVARAQYEVADRAFRLEIRKQYPDIGIGPLYEDDEGVSKAGLLLGVPLPLWNRNRRAIAETRAARDAAKAAWEAEYERLVAELSQVELGVRAARLRSELLENTVAPMADRQMGDLRRLAELGDLDVFVILDALTRTLETKEEVLAAKVEESVAVTELRALLRPAGTPAPEDES